MIKFRQGDVYYFKLDPTVGNEMKKTRPCMIISNDHFNRHYNTRWIIPISSRPKYRTLMRYRLSPFFVPIEVHNSSETTSGNLLVQHFDDISAKDRCRSKLMGRANQQIVVRCFKCLILGSAPK